MGQATVGGIKEVEKKGEVYSIGGNGKIVIDKIEVITRRYPIDVPELRIVSQDTIKYNTLEEPTIKYVPSEEPTTKYKVIEQPTVRYIERQEETIKYTAKEVTVEKPVLKEVTYEKPIIVEREIEVMKPADLLMVKELLQLLPNLMAKLQQLKEYKLVEEVVKVPQIQYEPVKVERIVWVDKERDKKTGDLVK